MFPFFLVLSYKGLSLLPFSRGLPVACGSIFKLNIIFLPGFLKGAWKKDRSVDLGRIFFFFFMQIRSLRLKIKKGRNKLHFKLPVRIEDTVCSSGCGYFNFAKIYLQLDEDVALLRYFTDPSNVDDHLLV